MGFFSQKKILVTHDSTFHADDVFATATLLMLLKDEAKVIRTRDEQKIATADFVYDVGGEDDPEKNRFDHHQIGGAGARPNGVPYASFGLVWKKYGEELCGSKEAADAIDEKLVQAIDAADNGVNTFTPSAHVSPYLIQSFLYALRPSWLEDQDYDKSFHEAVLIAKIVLRREIKRTIDDLIGEKKVFECYQAAEDKRLIVLDAKYPWEEATISYPEPLFVVAPRPDGKWKSEPVFSKPGSFERRKYFPQAWAGKRDEELQKITGVPDAVFCHNGRFIAVALSKEGALKLAQIALES